MTATYSRISEPGKFEGELSIVPKMWEIVLEGFSADVYLHDRVYSFVSLIAVDEPTNNGLYGAMLWEDENGFVHSEWQESKGQYDCRLREMEQLAEGQTDSE